VIVPKNGTASGQRAQAPVPFETRDWELDIMMFAMEHHDVRTTLTIDDRLAAQLKEEMRRTGLSFKETLERVLRVGLERRHERKRDAPFKVKARALGLRPGIDLSNVAELLEQIEGPHAL
jgi:hypothetical protein